VADNWESCAWEFRRGNCFQFLEPPIGLRLPLDSLPKTSKKKKRAVVDRSLFEDLPALVIMKK
jgi:uncharacterized protein (DUF2126 family)